MKTLQNVTNPVSFQVMLQFCCNAGDGVLSQHLNERGKNKTFRSKTIQNEINTVLGDKITEKF